MASKHLVVTEAPRLQNLEPLDRVYSGCSVPKQPFILKTQTYRASASALPAGERRRRDLAFRAGAVGRLPEVLLYVPESGKDSP